jgi:hypothetical protein
VSTEIAGSMGVVQRRLYQMMAGSEQVMSMVPTHRLAEEFIAAAREPELAALHNGTRIRTLYTSNVLNHGPSMEFIRETVGAGAEARLLERLPTWLTIIGREVVVVPRDPDGAEPGVVFVHGSGRVNAALWFFGHAWAAATPMPAEDRPIELSAWERRVLFHLARGTKDETGARHLGVSARTYRRHATELCERLGASSRFEAGVLAARAGLI